MKRMISFLVLICMLCTVFSQTVFAEFSIPVVTGIEIKSYPKKMEYISDFDYEFDFSGIEVEIFLSDGSSIIRYARDVNTTVQSDKTKADYGKATVEYSGFKESFFFKEIENPVKSIEFLRGDITTYKDVGIFDFEFYEKQYKITYKDGTEKTVDNKEEVAAGNKLSINMPTSFGLGKNYVDISFGKVKTRVCVTLIENTMERLVIERAPACVYQFGNREHGSSKPPMMVMARRYDYEQLKFSVYHKDGRKETFYGYEIDYYDRKLGNVYCSVTGNDPYSINPFYMYAGTYDVTLTYGNLKATYPMTLTRRAVENIEVIKQPPAVTYDMPFTPSFLGMQLRLNYRNGAVKNITLTKDNVFAFTNMDCNVWIDDAKTDYLSVGNGSVSGLDCFTSFNKCKEEHDRYKLLEIIDFSSDLIGMKARLVKPDGSEMIFPVTNDAAFKDTRQKGVAQKYMELFTHTDVGIYSFHIHVKYDENGAPVSYSTNNFATDSGSQKLSENASLKGISVLNMPSKIRYSKGEKFDGSGLVLSLDFGKGLIGNARFEDGGMDVEVDTEVYGKKTARVTYKGKSATFIIEVTDGFSDVKKGSWYEPSVTFAYKHGIFDGMDSVRKLFLPDSNITRAQFVKVLANISGVDTSNNNVKSGFTDVPSGKWYTAAIKWAVDNRITSGMGDGTFKPDEKITREQMCVLLVMYVEKYKESKFDKVLVRTDFKDYDKVSVWARRAVTICTYSGLISGMGDGNFSPKSTASRAQAATVFTSFYKNSPYTPNVK